MYRSETSGRAFTAVGFVYLSVECPFNKFYGINCSKSKPAKLLAVFVVDTNETELTIPFGN
jgi:hypothetical protein